MISLTLICQAEHEFDAWFRDSSEYDKQRKRRLVECPVCGDRKITRSLSAPNISSSKTQGLAAAEVRKHLREFRKQVEASHENVGERFAEEARKIHYGETEARGIYGKATGDEAKELVDEGVPFSPMPWIEEAQDN